MSRALLLVRSVDSARAFFHGAFGLPILHARPGWLQLDAGRMPIDVQEVPEAEAQLCTGYSPMLQFDVADLHELVPRLLGAGATMDGPIRYATNRTVSVMRAPTGHMLSLVETTTPARTHSSTAAQEHRAAGEKLT